MKFETLDDEFILIYMNNLGRHRLGQIDFIKNLTVS